MEVIVSAQKKQFGCAAKRFEKAGKKNRREGHDASILALA